MKPGYYGEGSVDVFQERRALFTVVLSLKTRHLAIGGASTPLLTSYRILHSLTHVDIKALGSRDTVRVVEEKEVTKVIDGKEELQGSHRDCKQVSKFHRTRRWTPITVIWVSRKEDALRMCSARTLRPGTSLGLRSLIATGRSYSLTCNKLISVGIFTKAELPPTLLNMSSPMVKRSEFLTAYVHFALFWLLMSSFHLRR